MKRFVYLLLSVHFLLSIEMRRFKRQVFILYSLLHQSKGEFQGLGHVDSRKDTLDVLIELKPDEVYNAQQVSPPDLDLTVSTASSKARRRNASIRRSPQENVKIIEIELFQDKTALRTRQGDTGSVLWRIRLVNRASQ